MSSESETKQRKAFRPPKIWAHQPKSTKVTASNSVKKLIPVSKSVLCSGKVGPTEEIAVNVKRTKMTLELIEGM